jgi:hypothetical protein
MAFPTSPTNGQTTTINGITYIYNSTKNTWTIVSGSSTGITASGLNATIANTIISGGSSGQVLGTNGSGGLSWVNGVPVATAVATGATTTNGTFYPALISATSGNLSLYGNSGVSINPSSGNLYATGEVTSYFSDERLKINVQSIPDALVKIKEIRGVTFDWTTDTIPNFKPDGSKGVGVIAQEIEKVLPEVIRLAPFDRAEDGSSLSGNNYLTVQYEKLSALLIQAIKELSVEVELLKEEVQTLKK